MPNYIGRLSQQAEVTNFKGINSKSSIVSKNDGEAVDIDNWDIDLSGTITSRQGYIIKQTFANDVRFVDTFFTMDGVQIYIAVSGDDLWEAPAITGPWSNRGGTLTTGDYTYVGTSLNGRYMLCNGVDEPIIFTPGQTVVTLKDASLLDPPQTLIGIATPGTGGTTYKYVVTGVTPRGESLPSNIVTIFNGGVTLSATVYNTLSWASPAGAYAQKVYRWNSGTSTYDFIALLVGTATSYVDNGATATTTLHPPTANTSYNTPLDWETNGQPEGCFVLSRGRDQRMMAWRGSDVFVSALSNVYDWYSPNDSFAFTVLGGQDSNVKAVTTLFDYTLVFSRTNCFIYSGSNYTDFALGKITQTGCSSHYSITAVGDDVYLWSQFGPTTVKRILAGADVETNVFGAKISPITFGTNLPMWTKVKVWHDLVRQRVCWALPGAGQTLNTMVLAYNYQTKGWTKFSGWQIEQIAYDPVAKANYACVSGGNANCLVELHTGSSDGGVAIENSYTGIYDDFRTFLKKRSVFLDVMMDPSTDYNVAVTLNLDFQSPASTPQTYTLTKVGSVVTTEGEDVVLQGNLVNIHRIVVFGCARYMQLTFSDLGKAGGVKIFGWRLDERGKGIR